MRLNKFISSTGICSRREADKLIEEGKVLINGAVAAFTSQITEQDVVTVNGKTLQMRPPEVIIALHKPRGITCTTELEIEGNIIDYIQYPERIFPIGRLDKDSTGLILLTNNGDLVNAMLRSEHHHSKEYIVRVDKPVTAEIIKKLSTGIQIYNPVHNRYETTNPCEVNLINPHTFRMILTQGLNRQIRRMCTACGLHVQSLKRVRFLTIPLGELKEGSWRQLTAKEIADLKQDLKL